MLYAASAFAAVLPMIIYMILIWRFDRYDREPFGLVLRNFLWGGAGAIILTMAGSGTLSGAVSLVISDPEYLSHIETILIAPFVEEITKGLFLFITISGRKFDNMTDGFVYGGAIGLGFGMTENFLYFISYGTSITDWLFIVIMRTLFSAVMHCVATATLGAFLGYAKFKGPFIKYTFPFIGLGTAMFIHFAWNLSVSFENTAIIGFIFMIFTILIFIGVFAVSILNEKKIIYRELLEESQNGLIPIEHLQILNSSKRNKFGWVNEDIRKVYIRAATTLAFRKMQSKNSSGQSRLYYENDVDYYRNYIQNLLISTRLDS